MASKDLELPEFTEVLKSSFISSYVNFALVRYYKKLPKT